MSKIKTIKNSGITLIALVITIIVLLILAGVSIAMLTGENGILTQANNAKEKTEEAKEEELRKLTALEATTNIENKPYNDKNGDTAIIPAGFAVSQVEGENTIEDGLVIIDKSGNEFVWVPVNNQSEEIFKENFKQIEGYQNNQKQDELVNIGEANSLGINNWITESEETEKEAIAMYNSVYANGGFYIGRYESGKTSDGDVVIKKGVEVYRNIPWSVSENMIETQEVTGGAIELARNFDTKNGYTAATTTLCYGVQWDTTLRFIDENYENYAKNSEGKGNYNAIDVIPTGSNEEFAEKNIYDMAGNVYEWTMETYKDVMRVTRGGNYGIDGSVYPASFRNHRSIFS